MHICIHVTQTHMYMLNIHIFNNILSVKSHISFPLISLLYVSDSLLQKQDWQDKGLQGFFLTL